MRRAWSRSTSTAIGAAYYTGNCHKWLCGPKGSAFLHVRRDRQADVRPLAISHGANSDAYRSLTAFGSSSTGPGPPTRSAYLALPTAIRFMGSLLPGGWPELMAANRNLALAARDLLCQAFEVDPPAPDDMLGSMAAVPLPGPAGSSSLQDAWTIGEALFRNFGIEVPIIGMPGPLAANGEAELGAPDLFVRISAQRYNTLGQYARLGDALLEILGIDRSNPALRSGTSAPRFDRGGSPARRG